jgi:DNA repair exonuclease SbcCD ATPase subunit
MPSDLLGTLTKFHRDVVLPDIERIIDARIVPLRQDTLSHFDAMYVRFDRLETEYAFIKAGLQRFEERLAEQKLDRASLRSELLELRERVLALEQRITDLDADL